MSGRRDISQTVATNLVLAFVNAVTGILLARLLGPEGRGQLAAVLVWGTTIAGLAGLGVHDAVVYFVAARPEETGRTTASAAVLELCTSACFTAVAWFVVPLALGGQAESTKDLARMFVLVIPLFVLAGLPASALRGASEYGRWNALRLSAPVLWLSTILVGEATGHLSVRFLTLGYLLSQVVLLCITTGAALPRLVRPIRAELDRWPALLRFGLPGVLSAVPAMANLRLDQMLLAAFVSNEKLGLYVAAVAWAGMLSPVLSAFGSVLFPRLAGQQDPAARVAVLRRVVRMATLVAAALGVAAALATPLGIRVLFGRSYADAVPAALILVLASVFLEVENVLEDAFRGLGQPGEVLRAELGGLLVTALLLAVLLPSLDITGAAIASVGGYVATTAILVRRLGSGHGVRARELLPTGVEVRELLASGAGAAERVRRSRSR